MANIKDIKTLRNKTGAGFADCKKALEESNNDIEAAIKRLKEMGKAAAEKRSDRTTSEGSIFAEARGNKAVLLELLCETDFVARNEEFQKLGKDIINDVFEKNLNEEDESILNRIQEVIGKIKENMTLGRLKVIEKSDNEIFSTYTHGIPARLGAVVCLKSDNTSILKAKEIVTFAFNCALHSVARTPLFLSQETISESYKSEQMDIINTQVTQMGKPENVAQGIALGKWNKHTTEICFLLQPWVHDEKTTAKKELEALSKSVGSEISLSNFEIFILGLE